MDILDTLLRYGFLQRALLAGLIVAVVAGLLGVFLVLRGMSLLGDGLAHVSFAGIAIGLVSGLMPIGTAFVVSIVGAILVHLLRQRQVVRSDTAIGIIFTGGLALGVLLVSWHGGLASAQTYLFGSLLAITSGELWATALVAAALIVLLAAFYRPLSYLTFSEEAATVSGLPVQFLDILFVSMTAAAIVMAARITGVLLVSALLIVPAASALQLRRGFRLSLVLSVAFGVASVLLGLALSVSYDLAPGASIAAVSIALFATAAGARALVRSTS